MPGGLCAAVGAGRGLTGGAVDLVVENSHYSLNSVTRYPHQPLERRVLISMLMVRLTVTLSAPANYAQDLVEAFRFLMVSTRLDRGCLGCSVWTEPDSSVHYVEEWSSEEDIRRRVGSDRFTSVLALLESAREPPQVKFDFVSNTRGLDYVAEVRQSSAS